MIDYTLEASSPLVFDPRVKRAQNILNGKNVYHRDFHRGQVDGVFGPETGRSCRRAKFWLGYPTDELKPTDGPNLEGFLTGEKQRSDEMQNRAQLRQEQAGKEPFRVAALRAAVGELGTKESPAGSNRQKYGVWYGMNGVPWCAIFDSWCFDQTGYKSFRYSYVPAVHSDATYCRNRLCVVRSPQPGDLVCFNFHGGRDVHIEFFEKWAQQGSTFSSVGGNTSASNWSNGGEVGRQIRYVSTVGAFVRVT